VIQGEHLTGNLGVVRDSGNALHIQEFHDEILVIVAGGVRFQVGNEINTVKEGNLVFIPRGTLHGPILEEGERFSALSVFGPQFDLTRENIQ
jgi:quercetin dioxygenase-like cupin family protein